MSAKRGAKRQKKENTNRMTDRTEAFMRVFLLECVVWFTILKGLVVFIGRFKDIAALADGMVTISHGVAFRTTRGWFVQVFHAHNHDQDASKQKR